QCHVEMTEDLIKVWVRSGADEIRASSSPAVQKPDEITSNIEPRLDKLHEVANQLYDRWIESLAKG
ncbi:MAG TPA: hypothetical protein VF210_01085, partial [Pseudomonadales bacterium]